MFKRLKVSVPTLLVTLFVALYSLGGVAQSQCSHARTGLQENRYIFEGNFRWSDQAGADELLRRVKRAGFNVLVPAVWKGRGTGWPSELADKEMKWIKQGVVANFDPLAYLIDQAHSMDIEVHPWFTLSKRQADFLPQYHDVGTPEKFFNVHRADFRALIADLVEEVVAKYDVDGVNLDYVRAGGVCRAPMCKDNYAAATGHNLMSDWSLRGVSGAAKQRLSQWNATAVEAMVRGVSNRVRIHKPEIPISVDTHLGVDELVIQGVNSPRWLKEGVIDLIFHMQYLTVSNDDLQRLNSIRAGLVKPHRLILLVGNFSYSRMRKADREIGIQPAATVADFIARGRRFSQYGNGVGLFEYIMMADEQAEAIALGPFLDAADPRGGCLDAPVSLGQRQGMGIDEHL